MSRNLSGRWAVQEYLQRWKKTLVVVSHDRDFLNTVTTDIIHLHDLKLQAYRGNFAQFEEMYEQRRREVNKVAEKFEKQMKVAKKTGSKASQDKVGGGEPCLSGRDVSIRSRRVGERTTEAVLQMSLWCAGQQERKGGAETATKRPKRCRRRVDTFGGSSQVERLHRAL